jgi:hypothetical protein
MSKNASRCLIYSLLLIFFAASSALGLSNNENKILSIVKSLTRTNKVKTAKTLLPGSYEAEAHPAGWTNLINTSSAIFDKVTVSVGNNDKIFTDVTLDLPTTETGITKQVIINTWGRAFQMVPQMPEGFDGDAISYTRRGNTQLMFFFTVDETCEYLSQVIIRKF